MAFHRSPDVASQPHKDSQAPTSPPGASSDELQAFYEDAERTDLLERKLSKRNSHSGASIWSRKSIKRSTLTPAVRSSDADLPRVPSGSNLQDGDNIYGTMSPSSQGARSDLPRLTTSRSVIGTRRDSPGGEENDAWTGVPLPALKVKYPLHNPLGPRWYKNHHLIPPSQKKPSMRPPTFFSTSFPPMHTSSSPEHVEDVAESSNAASRSPIPTPASSQTRVGETGKPRSRKTSQTAPDTVDLLDVTDPWGTNWHHQSPYDIGQTTTVADPHEIPGRKRRASMTAAQNGKPLIPSPLSQSTSAVHLQSVAPEIHVPRKLSKRRTPTAANVFNPPASEEGHRKYASAPATPIEQPPVAPAACIIPSGPVSLPKRMSVAPALPYSSMQPTPKKEKRGSMLNRLAKKFSLIRRLTDDHDSGSSDWWNIEKHEAKGYVYGSPYEPPPNKGRTSPDKPRAGSAKRVPPPSVEPPAEPPLEPPVPEPSTKDAERASLSSLDTPYSIGKLTITNPDIPESNDNSLGDQLPPLPPEKPKDTAHPLHRSDEPSEATVASPPPPAAEVISQRFSNDIRADLDKPLPPPQLATPQFSVLGLSEIQVQVQTPKPAEEPLPHTQPIETVDSHPPPCPEPPEKTTNVSIPPPDTSLEDHKAASSIVFPDRERTFSPAPMEAPEPRRPSPDKDLPSPVGNKEEQFQPQSPPTQVENVKRKSTRAQPSSQSREDGDRSGEASSSSHRTRNHRSNSRHESVPQSKPASVPFPTTQHLAPPESRNKRDVPQPDAADSPMSTSSMLANPPTPYDNRLSIALSDQTQPPTLPPKSIYEVKIPPNPPVTTPSPRRQTETFKLVRSLSGNVYASTETITAGGQQWEVVESLESKPRKDRTSARSKDLEQRLRDKEYRSSKDHDRSRDYERSSKDYESSRPKDDRKSRDYEHKSRDYEVKAKDKDDRYSRDYEHKSRDYDLRTKERDDRKSRDYEHYRSRDYDAKVKDGHKSRDYDQKPKDYEQRSKDYGIPSPKDKEYKDDRRHKDYERKSRDYEPKSREESKPRERDYEYRLKEADHRKEYERRPDNYDRNHKDYDQRPKEVERRSKDYERKHSDHDRSPKDYSRKTKEYESSGRREKESKTKVDPNDAEIYRSSHKSSKQPVQHHQEEVVKSQTPGKSSSYHPEERSRHDEPRSTRKKEDRHERKAAKKPTPDTSSSNPHYHQVTPPVQYVYAPAEVAEPPPRRLERNPSTSARPTSELPSAAEMTAVRAKESWEMERLWKGRSMYGHDPNGQVTNYIPETSSSSSRSDDVNTHSAVYGSSHTAYVVQSPFQTSNLGSQIYHSMPTGPPPIIYSSPASIPSIPDTFSSYEPYDNVYRSYATASTIDYKSPPTIPRPSLNNPLPEPPKESDIDLSSLKASAKPSSRHTNDYWTKYNGITTTH
ncbi:hypothetical protein D9613_002162 [Agrocybe pediades]|uniref:Uncharacterized protein n=1 Tax=Agrocybe pediades TaxID=84607 RepID=A0A8H4R480_9AGAR|nr:hypothetical protein D9613_002162 [Agrocybe pediades]